MALKFKDLYMAINGTDPTDNFSLRIFDKQTDNFINIDLNRSPKLLYALADYYVSSLEVIDDYLDVILEKNEPSFFESYSFVISNTIISDSTLF